MQNGQVDFFGKHDEMFIMLFLLRKKTNIKNRYTGKIILLERGELTDG
jgi:hypothetical protein